MNVQHGFAFVETLYRANHYTVGITATIAGLGYNMSHLKYSSQTKSLAAYHEFAIIAKKGATDIICAYYGAAKKVSSDLSLSSIGKSGFRLALKKL
jgi:hypothetical protein